MLVFRIDALFISEKYVRSTKLTAQMKGQIDDQRQIGPVFLIVNLFVPASTLSLNQPLSI